MRRRPSVTKEKNPENQRRGRASRMKGKRGEREIASQLREIFGPQVRRGWQARDGADAPDVDGTPFFIEAKWRKRVQVGKAIEQALEAKTKSKDGRPIMVVAHEDRRPTFVSLLLDDFLPLLRAALASGWAEKGAVLPMPSQNGHPPILESTDFDL